MFDEVFYIYLDICFNQRPLSDFILVLIGINCVYLSSCNLVLLLHINLDVYITYLYNWEVIDKILLSHCMTLKELLLLSMLQVSVLQNSIEKLIEIYLLGKRSSERSRIGPLVV